MTAWDKVKFRLPRHWACISEINMALDIKVTMLLKVHNDKNENNKM